jgi:hypothetical protein
METGCVIDMNHFSAMDFNQEIVYYARQLGWDGGQTDLSHLDSDFIHIINGTVPEDFDGTFGEFEYEYSEMIFFTADNALAWLNDKIAHDDHYFTIDDNSLYYWKVDDDAVL